MTLITLIPHIAAFTSVFLLVFSFSMKTNNLASSVIFKVIPCILGVIHMLLALKISGMI